MHHGLKLNARIIAGPGKLIEIIEDIALNRHEEGVAGPAQCFDTKIPIGMQLLSTMPVAEVENSSMEELYTRMREDFFYPVLKSVAQKAQVVRHDVYTMDEYLKFLITQKSLRFVLASSYLGDQIEADPDAMARITAETYSYRCGHFQLLFESPKEDKALEDMEVLRLNDKLRFNLDKPTVVTSTYNGEPYYMISAGVGLGMMGSMHKLKILGP